MLLDADLLLDSASAITSSAASANTIDLSEQRDMGIGDDPALKLLCLVDTAFTSTNSATLQVLFQGSTDNSTWDTYAESPAYAAAALVAGARLFDTDVPRPAAGKSMPRYQRLYYAVGTGVFSTGSVTSAIVLGRDDEPAGGAYPSGFTVAN